MIKNLKTKKTLRVLATKKVTSVALFDFRSLEEIQEYASALKSEFNNDLNSFNNLRKLLAVNSSIVTSALIKKLKTKTNDKLSAPDFVKPNMDKLGSAFSVVDKYQDKLDSLDTVLNILQLEFKGERGAPNAVKELKAFKVAIKTKLDSAYKFLSELANNHEPQSFKDLVDSVYERISSAYGESYEDTKHVVYMIPQDDDKVLISHYIDLINFTDDNEYVHPNYFLVISALIDIKDGKSTYFVNALQNYASPTKAGKGIQVDDVNEAAMQAVILLEHAGFSSTIDKTPIPTDQTKLDRINWNAPKEWIKKVSLNDDNDAIRVEFTKAVNKENLQDAINHFTVDLKTSIIPNNYRMGIKNKKYRNGKLYSADFIFTLPDAHQRREIKLDAGKVKKLRDMFGMNDKQAGELIKYFNTI